MFPIQPISRKILSLISALSLLFILTSCGGGGSGGSSEAVPKDITFFSLDSKPNSMTRAFSPEYAATNPVAEPLPNYASSPRSVRVFQILQTTVDAAPYLATLKARSEQTPDIGGNAPKGALPVYEPGFFANNTLIILGFVGDLSERVTLVHLIEYNDRIEATPEVCDTDRMNVSPSGDYAQNYWFSIAKTTKPLVTLPALPSKNAPFFPGEIGACPGI